MADPMTEAPDPVLLRQKALARWDNEGGAGPEGPQRQDKLFDVSDNILAPENAELMQLRIRVTALESLVITLLVEATDAQKSLARELAAHILPPPGSTQHSLTLTTARHMLTMVELAEHFVKSQPARYDGSPIAT